MPTTDLAAGPRLIIRSVPLPTPDRGAVARRLRHAARVTARHLGPVAVAAARTRRYDEAATAVALRAVFDEMGGTFAKFGQLIGSSPSLFGEVVAGAFRGTLDAVVPVPFHEVKLTVEDELGLPLPLLFSSFDEVPIAAASVAQVHRATLLDGREVAVKVLRPRVEHAMAVDIAVMIPLFGFLGRQVAIGVFGELPSLVSGLAEQLSEEVDLRNEARSMAWFAHLVETLDLHRIEVPAPEPGYVTRRVLAMSFIDGVPVDHVEAIEAMGVDPAPLVQETVRAWFASALCTGAFHGDVHAGNLLVTPRGNLGVLDWGIVGRFDDHTQRFFRRTIEGVLGDESAWADVQGLMKDVYGPGLQEQIGADDAQMALLLRMQIEPLFRRPFGEIDLTNLIVNETAGSPLLDEVGAGAAKPRSTYQLWRAERARRREQAASGARETTFDRGMFLLGKQLVYFDRYGKLFLPDTPLLWDEDAFHRLLAEPMVPAEDRPDGYET